MNPDPYDDDHEESGGDPDPAKWPPRKPGRPYGVYPEQPGLRRTPGAPMETRDPTPAALPTFPAPAAAPPPPPPRPPKPLLRRQERFCYAYVLRGNATRAAWDAGYSGGSGANHGYRLLQRPEIQARIAEIQRGLARGFAGDAEALLGKLEAVYRHAVDGGYLNAAVRVVEVQARMAGHLRSRVRAPETENDEK